MLIRALTLKVPGLVHSASCFTPAPVRSDAMAYDSTKSHGPGPRLLASYLLAFIFAVLNTTLFDWWALGPLKLQPLIPVVVSAGFKLPLLHGGILVLFIGYVSDVLSAGVVGLEITAYELVFICCALAQRRLEINSWPLQMLSVGLMALLFQTIVALGLSLVEREHLTTGNLSWVMMAQALLSAFTAPLFVGCLELVTMIFRRMWPEERNIGL